MSDNSPLTSRAYVVSQPREKGGKCFWHEVGAVWPLGVKKCDLLWWIACW